MNIKYLVEVFVKTIEELMKMNRSNIKIYVMTKNDEYINFRTKAFKKKLSQLSEIEVTILLSYFKELKWIVTKNEKFSNVQWINGKSMRVMTIEKNIYELLKGLIDVENKV